MESDAMTEDEKGITSSDTPGALTPPVNAAALDIALHFIAVAADPREARKRLKGYYEALTAADAAQKNLVAAQTEFALFEERTRRELTDRAASLRKRELKIAADEGALEQRHEDIARLESAWKNLGEPESVRSGFQSPEFTALQKARRAHGQSAADGELPLTETALTASGFDGGEFPPDVTLMRERAISKSPPPAARLRRRGAEA
jgi:hypothetical protein